MLSDSERRTMRDLEADLLADRAFARTVLPVARRLGYLAAPVVLGVAADESSASALDWAVAEAVAQRCPLRIVHAWRTPVALDPLGAVPTIGGLGREQTWAAQVLDEALDRARSLASGVEVSARVVQGRAAGALLRESRDARLIVLGAGPPVRPVGVQRLLHGAVRTRLTASARCPVAVVHRGVDTLRSPVASRVVVGVDGTSCSDAAAEFAFRVAGRRGLSITAVHARTADPYAAAGPSTNDENAAYRLVDQALAPWHREFPRVPVTVEVTANDPAGALVERSAGAALVVVGSRGRGVTRGAVFGSVSHAVLDGAAAPVAVVRRFPPGYRSATR